MEDCTFRFSKWDPDDRETYIGTPQQWEEAQGIMEKILRDLGVEYKVGIGEAAFYGPKLDIQYRNVFGKEDTIVTIQVDQLLAKQFGMEYRDAQLEKIPYMLIAGDRELEQGTVSVRHRSEGDLGTMPFEEFLALLGSVVETKQKS